VERAAVIGEVRSGCRQTGRDPAKFPSLAIAKVTHSLRVGYVFALRNVRRTLGIPPHALLIPVVSRQHRMVPKKAVGKFNGVGIETDSSGFCLLSCV
jgi:hypothetical protein